MNTSEAIKKARKDAGITQAELAERLGITPQMISQYERGAKKPSVETAEKIFNALGVTEWDVEMGDGLIFSRRQYKWPDNLTPYLRTLHGEGIGPAASVEQGDTLHGSVLTAVPGSTAAKAANLAHLMGHISAGDIPDTSGAAPAQVEKLLQDFNKLNPAGREKALERVHELTEVPRYTFPAVTPAPASAAESAQTTPQSPAGDTDTHKQG